MSKLSDDARDALAEFLLRRDGASGRIGPSTRFKYACRAAAILNGEAWAIRETWPEVMAERGDG
ncbi:MAG TPA: hypothetical protein VFH54_19395 [Mycobacteriales bacterium]|nr:hypothetical protein [Mycobacteriales bacterium]